ncbi:MAG: hypothetical protein FWG32_07875, partial [Oscillospiraceae bacterium]|nr:hypothetical protein [Oscillospiraceae bacterium]
YGGHLQMLVALPVTVVTFLIIPRDKKISSVSRSAGVRTKLPARAYYYTMLIVIFMIVYNVSTVNISTHLASGGIGGPSTAGAASAFLMMGGVVAGLVFPKLSRQMRDFVFPSAFFLLACGYMLMNMFPVSTALTFAAMFICGSTMSLLVPRCIFNTSNLSDPMNSATATMLVCCIAPGAGHFLSPVIMTNLTLALGGESTRFRFMFTAAVCAVIAAALFIYQLCRERNAKGRSDAQKRGVSA